MQPQTPHARTSHKVAPVAGVGTAVDRAAGVVRDDEASVGRQRAGRDPLGGLPSVLVTAREDGFGDGDGASPGLGLGWAEVGAAAVSTGARRGTFAAYRLGVDGCAAVLPWQPGEGVSDAGLAALEVDVVPTQRERLALPEPEECE